jgi:hypothetical protein
MDDTQREHLAKLANIRFKFYAENVTFLKIFDKTNKNGCI